MSAVGEGDRQNWEISALSGFSSESPSYVFIWFVGLAKTACFGTWLPIYNQHEGIFFKL